MAEWPNAVVLKTIEPKGSEGSNPSLSAIAKQWQEQDSNGDAQRITAILKESMPQGFSQLAIPARHQ